MAPKKAMKRPASSQKKPAGVSQKEKLKKAKKVPKAGKPFCKALSMADCERLKKLKGYIVNLERRPDRWERVSKMLKKETPWLSFEAFPASDGTKNPIPEEEVAATWNTSCNAVFADYYEWVFDAPGNDLNGTMWKWACEADSDEVWKFEEHLHDGEEWSYIHHAGEKIVRTATVEKIATKETFKLKLQFAEKYKNPGQIQRMSGGERGCAHSHLRLWRIAAESPLPTLALEDDVTVTFDRSGGKGKASGKVFTERLGLALKHAPADFDVIYLGWSGWRGGHYRHWTSVAEDSTRKKYMRPAEYVWTTVAYVISQAGAKKLLAAAQPMTQPVDNFMAWEASQGRLKSYVAIDAGDDDGTWAGGIVDQVDFQGDSDIQKSDGGHQGDDEKQFAVPES
jgi:GR25 family glycosyltransferase involved in LPS biosynthesis